MTDAEQVEATEALREVLCNVERARKYPGKFSPKAREIARAVYPITSRVEKLWQEICQMNADIDSGLKINVVLYHVKAETYLDILGRFVKGEYFGLHAIQLR